MRAETVSRTALGTAIGRAIESCRPANDRLFEDPFAIKFLPLLQRAVVRLLCIPIVGPALLGLREKQVPGIMGNLLCRTKFIDDALQKVLEAGFQQVVILGAGMDSRPYRISFARGVRVFEVDHPATQSWKLSRIKRFFGEVPSHVTFVPIDFEQQGLEEVIFSSGFETDARSVFIWEGVTQYISEESVEATLEFVSRATSGGGRLLFTYVHSGLINGSRMTQAARKLVSELERQGEPWCFGIDPAVLPQYLTSRGFRLLEDVGAEDYRRLYLEPCNRSMGLFDGERIAVVESVSETQSR